MKNVKLFVGLVLLLGLAAISVGQTTGTESAKRPNIILIVADDMDYTDVDIYGGKLTPTPHISSIAKNGVEATNAYVTCPVCGPSRVAILMGRYQDRIGYVTNHGPKIPENFGLPTTVTLISETLKSAGYDTGMIGKWHLGFKPDMVPNAQGFDYFFGHLHGWHEYTAGSTKPGPIMRNRTPVTTTKYLTREFGDEAAKFIDRHQERPYFLYVPFNAVHGPNQAPEETLERFAHIKDKRDRTMAAMVYELDVAVGQLLDAVKKNGDERNTLIIFTNDNGGVRPNVPEANGDLRGGKGTVYEGGIRVPMLFQWTGTLPAGKKYEKTVSTLDFAPTFVALAGAESTVDYEGVNLMPYLLGKNDGVPNPELYWHFVDAPNQKAVRKGDWKAVQPRDHAPWELYNLSSDAGEKDDIAGENRGKLKKLRHCWREWNSKNAPPMWLDVRIVRRREQLKKEHRAKANDKDQGTSEPRHRKKGKRRK